nr:hypothetical protein GCM10020093_080960 [Planobispora longispora]
MRSVPDPVTGIGGGRARSAFGQKSAAEPRAAVRPEKQQDQAARDQKAVPGRPAGRWAADPAVMFVSVAA